MPDENTNDFVQLLERVRGGDDRAAEEIVSRYQVEILREIRLRLTDPRMRRAIDSIDICQSVFGNFFARMTLGQFDLESPAQVRQLLVAMARNRLNDWVRRQQAQRRDQRREVALLEGDAAPAGNADGTPSQQVSAAELIRECRKRLTIDELQIVQQRIDGKSWGEIGQQLGLTADAARRRHARAIERVTQEMGLQ